MNFSDLHALKTLPGEIEKKNGLIGKMQTELAEAGLYARDPAKFAKLSKALAELMAARDAEEERWLALELQREEMDRQNS